jgi:hypothetical protein
MVRNVVNSFAFVTDVSCTWVISVGHDAESVVHSLVDSADADEAPRMAIAINAASAARPSIFSDFTLFSLLDLRPEFGLGAPSPYTP